MFSSCTSCVSSSDGKEISFCCLGFMPFGLPLENVDRDIDNNWSPFSPMFTCQRYGGNGGSNVNNHVVEGQNNVSTLGSSHKAGGSISGGGRKDFSPMIYIDDDDDDVFVEVSKSNVDWNRNKEECEGKKCKDAK